MANAQLEDVRDRIQKDQVKANELRRAVRNMCRDLEQLISDRIDDFESLTQIDEDYRSRVFRGEVEYNPDFDAAMSSLLRQWVQFSDQLAEEIAGLQAMGIEVRRADDFLRCYREAKGILTDDARFFAAPELAELRDRAIDEQRAGKCEPA